MFAVVEKAARDSGLELDLTKQPTMYPTLAAHTLLRHAVERGTQVALMQALYQAYFIEAQNIADPEVLAALGAQHGFSHDEARRLVTDAVELLATQREADVAVQRGVRGVPLFVFDQRLAVSGAQRPQTLRAALSQALAERDSAAMQ
jgi:predicted DsbA family dithiol-disulfide isomerase